MIKIINVKETEHEVLCILETVSITIVPRLNELILISDVYYKVYKIVHKFESTSSWKDFETKLEYIFVFVKKVEEEYDEN